MTREELIESLWRDYSVGEIRIVGHYGFAIALSIALDAQARGCAEAWLATTIPDYLREQRRKLSPDYQHLLTADPEVTP